MKRGRGKVRSFRAQGSANNSPVRQIQLPPVLLELSHTHLSMYCSWLHLCPSGTTAPRSWDRDLVVYKVANSGFLALPRKSLPPLALEFGSASDGTLGKVKHLRISRGS